MEPWREWLRPELIWFFVGLFLLFAEMVVPGFIVAFFAFGAWVVAAVQLCKPLTVNQQLALFIALSLGEALRLHHGHNVLAYSEAAEDGLLLRQIPHA